MIAHYIEASNDGMNWGKFLLLRHEQDPGSALPGYEGEPLLTSSRKFNRVHTMVIDLQTGEGAAFALEGSALNAHVDLERHKIWVCPLYEPFLQWLYEQPGLDMGRGDITALPRFVELDASFAWVGHRRAGGDDGGE
jgi:hypothetical protein